MSNDNDNLEEPKKGKVRKKKSSIEKSMSFGIDRNYQYLTEQSKNLSKNEVKAIALLKDDPFLKDEVANLVLMSVHVKGWITNMLYKFWTPFTKAFQSIYMNKKVQKALNRMSFGRFGGGDGDW